MRLWQSFVDLVDRALPKPAPRGKITLTNLIWDLEQRVSNEQSPRYGCGLRLTHSEVRDLLDILHTLQVAKAVGPTHREQMMMRRLDKHRVALPPFGCTWNRCVVPCETQAEHDGKAGSFR